MPSKSPAQVGPVSVTDAAYAAGFFDGEGCISITFHAGPAKKGGKTYHRERYSLAVSMSQNDKRPLEWLISRFGGSIRFVRGKRSYDHSRYYERWNWVISTRAAMQFLLITRPFLIVKAEQADLAFAFADTMYGRSSPGQGIRTPPAVQAVRAGIFQQMREMKRAIG